MFTERALFCRVRAGHVEIVDTLGLKEGEDVLTFLEERFTLEQSDMDLGCDRPASWPKYRQQVGHLMSDIYLWVKGCREQVLFEPCVMDLCFDFSCGCVGHLME